MQSHIGLAAAAAAAAAEGSVDAGMQGWRGCAAADVGEYGSPATH